MAQLLRRGSRGPEVGELQAQLNKLSPTSLPRLQEDGKFGPKTAERVREFQRQRHLRVDGIVGPNTKAALVQALQQSSASPGGKTPTKAGPAKAGGTKPTEPVNSPTAEPGGAASKHSPRKLSQADLRELEFATHYSWNVGSFGPAKAGVTYWGPDGLRLIYEVFHGAVVYQILSGTQGSVGCYFAQTKAGFISDIEAYVLSSAGKKASGMATVAEWEANILMGILSGMNALGFVAVASANALHFLQLHRHQFAAWKDLFSALLDARQTLRQYAPTLYEKLFGRLLREILRAAPGAGARDPGTLGMLIGQLISKAGNLRLAETVLWQTYYIFSILVSIAVAATKSVVNAVKPDDPQKLIESFRKGGVNITETEAQTITGEVRDHPHELRATLEKVLRAAAAVPR